METLNIEIVSGTPSKKWLQVAERKAREAAAARGVEWVDAKVFVALPEPGRCFTKEPGFTTLSAHG